MLHCHRLWSIVALDTAESLAEKLTEHTWCCCQGFQVGEYTFVNDATSPDGAQEYGVLKSDGQCLVQIESITSLG